METRRIEWKEDRDFTAEQVRATELNNSNNLLTSGRWPNKDPNDAHILALVGVSQKLSYNLKKHKINRTGIQQMITSLHQGPPTLDYGMAKKGSGKKKPRIENNIGGESNTAMENASGSTTIQKTT